MAMISRRSLLVGLLASVTMPRLPLPTPKGVSYIVFEPITLEYFERFHGDRIVIDDPWASIPIGYALNSAAKGEIVKVSLGGKRT